MPLIQLSGILGKANMTMRQVVVMTVQALPYHRALKAWPVGAVMLTTADPGSCIGGSWEHLTLSGLDAWRRLPSPHALGSGLLGALILGTEE